MADFTTHVLGRDLIDAIQSPEHLAKKSLRDWDATLRLAKRSNLIGRLAEGAHRHGVLGKVPEQVRVHLDSARVLTAHQRQAVAWEAGHIGKALQHIGTPVVLLKGAAYATAGLAAADGRLFGDIDVLVPKTRIHEAEAALMLRGWSSGQTDPYDERYYRQWMHELPPMVHNSRGTVIDVHHNILALTARDCPSAELLLAASVPVPGANFYVLSPCDMVIHSATHLFHEGELQNGLRDLFDLDALLGEFSQRQPGFWQELMDRAKLLGLTWPLHLALRYAKAILGAEVPEDVSQSVAQAAEIGAISQLMLDRMYMRAFKPDHPLCADFATDVARAAIYVRSHYLRMPIALLTVHLGRKAVMRLFKNTSRST